MLNNGLIETLLNKKIINKKTRVFAEYRKTDNSLRVLTLKELFTVEDVIKDKNGNYNFQLCRNDNKERVTLPSSQIVNIDGMSPELIAKAFSLKVDGMKNVSGKRRGRPRKYIREGDE